MMQVKGNPVIGLVTLPTMPFSLYIIYHNSNSIRDLTLELCNSITVKQNANNTPTLIHYFSCLLLDTNVKYMSTILPKSWSFFVLVS
jgi:hypothetical protein